MKKSLCYLMICVFSASIIGISHTAVSQKKQSAVPVLPLLENISVTSFDICRSNPKVLYAGTDEGVMKSTDSGLSWKIMREKPNAMVFVNEVSPDIVYLYEAG